MRRLGRVGIAALLLLPLVALADQGLYAEFYKDTPDQWGAFGSDPNSPQPYMTRIDPNIDFVFQSTDTAYISVRWSGYLYVPPEKAGDITFKTVTDDGVRLYIDGQLVLDFWRKQAHETIGTPYDECTHEVTLNLEEGYHQIVFEYFEWVNNENDPDPCKLYWNGEIIPSDYFYTSIPSNLQITNTSASPNPFNPSAGETCTISYEITEDATVSVYIYKEYTDPYSGAKGRTLVRTLLSNQPQQKGVHSVVWDGKSDSGELVLPDVYIYVIEATDSQGNTVVYDPPAPDADITDVSATPNPFHPSQGETCTIYYNLTANAKVRIRVGVPDGGPLVKTLMDWTPQQAGQHSVVWDGTDENGVIVDPGQYEVVFWAEGYPENGIIVEQSE